MRSLHLVLAAILSVVACDTAPPPRQQVLVPAFGGAILDDGAVILFEPGKSTMNTESEQQLVRMLPQIRSALATLPEGERRLCIAGHTDSVGADAANRSLSLRRAEAVAERMIDFGIALTDIVVRGYGSSRPFIARHSGVPDAHNRIVLISRGERCVG